MKTSTNWSWENKYENMKTWNYLIKITLKSIESYENYTKNYTHKKKVDSDNKPLTNTGSHKRLVTPSVSCARREIPLNRPCVGESSRLVTVLSVLTFWLGSVRSRVPHTNEHKVSQKTSDRRHRQWWFPQGEERRRICFCAVASRGFDRVRLSWVRPAPLTSIFGCHAVKNWHT